jgi:hypothetical protein
MASSVREPIRIVGTTPLFKETKTTNKIYTVGLATATTGLVCAVVALILLMSLGAVGSVLAFGTVGFCLTILGSGLMVAGSNSRSVTDETLIRKKSVEKPPAIKIPLPKTPVAPDSVILSPQCDVEAIAPRLDYPISAAPTVTILAPVVAQAVEVIPAVDSTTITRPLRPSQRQLAIEGLVPQILIESPEVIAIEPVRQSFTESRTTMQTLISKVIDSTKGSSIGWMFKSFLYISTISAMTTFWAAPTILDVIDPCGNSLLPPCPGLCCPLV